MLAATSAEVTLARWDCSITLDISTGGNADSRVRNLAQLPKVSSAGNDAAPKRNTQGDETENEARGDGSGGDDKEETGVSLLVLGGGVRASHGVLQGRACFEVYVKSLVEENVPAEIIVGASPCTSSLMIGADEHGVGLRNDGQIIRDGSIEANSSDKRELIMCGFYVTCCIDCNSGELSFFVNGRLTLTTRMSSTYKPGVTVMYPHICLKNCVVDVNFSKFKCKVPNEIPLAQLPDTHLIRSHFQKPSKPEVVMLIGPPSAGKSTAANEYVKTNGSSSEDAQQASKYYVISLETVAAMTTIDPQRVALTWEELVNYFKKVWPVLHRLAGDKPFQNYILDDVNGDPVQRAKTLAHFPSDTFTKVAAVVMPECPQLLSYHSKRKDVWKRRYSSQDVVDHLTASIQPPGPAEFDKVLFMGQETEEQVMEALQIFVQKAQNRVSHSLDEANGGDEELNDGDPPLSLAVATFSMSQQMRSGSGERSEEEQGGKEELLDLEEQGDSVEATNDEGVTKPDHHQEMCDNSEANIDAEDADEPTAAADGAKIDDEAGKQPEEPSIPLEDDDLKYLQSIASQCGRVSSRWPSLRHTRSDRSYRDYDVKVMFIVEAVDFSKAQGNSQRFIRVSNSTSFDEPIGLEEQDEEDILDVSEARAVEREEVVQSDDDFGGDEMDAHAGSKTDFGSSNPIAMLLSGAVERRKVQRLARHAKNSTNQRSKPRQNQAAEAATPRRAKPGAIALTPSDDYAFGVNAFGAKLEPNKRQRSSTSTPVNTINADPFSSDDDVPLVSGLTRKPSRSSPRPPATPAAAATATTEAFARKPSAKASVRYRPGAQTASSAGSAKMAFNGVAVAHLGDREHRVRGRLAVPDGSKSGFPTTRGFVATDKNTPEIPYFQHQKMRAAAEASKPATDGDIPTLPQETAEKKRAYELAWDDVGRRSGKRTLAQRQDMIAPGVPAPL